MELLQKVLDELLSEAQTAFAALRLIASKTGVLRYDVFGPADRPSCVFYYQKWTKEDGEWTRRERHFAWFYLAAGSVTEDKSHHYALTANPTVVKYNWGADITNPGGFLAKMLAKEKEKLASISRLQDVVHDAED